MQSSTMEVVADPAADFFYHPPSLVSEDCLYLNIWKPASGSRLPVLVWIHGGGEVQGSGSWPAYDGTALARKGVVVVTLNYRLGIFGRFALPALSEESVHGAGAYDLSDLIQALRWINANIAAFGGDAGRITVAGQSSGATYIALLMSSPPARGLFQRAIAESGSALYGPLSSLAEAEDRGLKFAAQAGHASLKALRDLPADDLLAASREFMPYQDPVIDGVLLPDAPCRIFNAGRQLPVPVLLGFNADELYELKGRQAPVSSRVAYEDSVKSIFREIGYQDPRLAKGFIDLLPKDPRRLAETDPRFRYGMTGWQMESWADAMRSAGVPTYLYYFRHVPHGAPSAYHAAEVPFVFDHPGPDARYSENMPAGLPDAEDNEMARLISGYWLGFVRDGTPILPSQAVWSAYGTGGGRNAMEFGRGIARMEARFFPYLKFRSICGLL